MGRTQILPTAGRVRALILAAVVAGLMLVSSLTASADPGSGRPANITWEGSAPQALNITWE